MKEGESEREGGRVLLRKAESEIERGIAKERKGEGVRDK